MRVGTVSALGLALWVVVTARLASAQLLPDFPIPDGAPPVAMAQAAEALNGALQATGSSGPFTHDASALGEGLFVVRAVQPDSYPGTGVASMVVDSDGARYGMHGDRDLADLVRARGWLTTPPANPELLMHLVDAGYFEGMGSTTLQPPGVALGEQRLTLDFSQFTPPGPTFPWQAVFPTDGPMQLFTVDNRPEATGGMRQVR